MQDEVVVHSLRELTGWGALASTSPWELPHTSPSSFSLPRTACWAAFRGLEGCSRAGITAILHVLQLLLESKVQVHDQESCLLLIIVEMRNGLSPT